MKDRSGGGGGGGGYRPCRRQVRECLCVGRGALCRDEGGAGNRIELH